MKRNHMIDILKGISIIMVVINHFYNNAVRVSPFFPYVAEMAVPIFMIISGYVYSLSFQNKAVTSISGAYKPSTLADRILRYTIPFAIIYFAELLMERNMGVQYSHFDLICNFLSGGFGYGSYYFPIMLQFIFVFPIIYFIVKKYDLSGVFLCGLLNFIFEFIQRYYLITDLHYRLLIFRYTLLISFGCFIFLKKTLPRKAVSFSSMILGAIFLWAVSYGVYTPRIVIRWTTTSFIAALYIMPIIGFLILSPKLQKLKCPPLEFLGKASYNIFLTQMFFYQYCAYPLTIRLPDITGIPMLLITLLLCLIGGILFYLAETQLTKAVIKLLHHFDIDHYVNSIFHFINSRLTTRR